MTNYDQISSPQINLENAMKATQLLHKKLWWWMKPLDISTHKNKGKFLICMDKLDNTLEIRLDFIQNYTLY